MPSDPRATATRLDTCHMVAAQMCSRLATLDWLWWLVAAVLCVIVGVSLFDTLAPIVQVLAAPFRVFFYPLELEWREGSFWLDALALSENAPIYDHSALAYVSMAHGPMDSLLKSWIARGLPFLAPWQVARFFVPLLPISLVVCSAMILRGCLRLHWLWGTLVGLTFFVAILAGAGGTFYLYGRTDDTATVLNVVAFTFLHFATQSPRAWERNGHALVAGLLLGASYLTIWRNFPVMGAMVLVAVGAIGLKRGRGPAASALLFCIAGALSVFVVILVTVMDGSISLFYEHFYKLFLVSYDTSAPARGSLGVPREIWDDLWPGWQSMVGDADNLLRRLAIIAVCPALLLAAARRPMREEFGYLRSTGFLTCVIGLYALALFSLVVGYLVHWRAGSLAYLAPIYLMSWYMVCLALAASASMRRAARGGVSAFLACGLVLLIVLFQVRGTSAGDEARRAGELTDAARAFDFQLARLQTRYTVVSDAYQFFKRHLGERDVVDQGDFSWDFARQGYFGEAFTRTVDRYIEDIRRNPPDIVIVGQISAPPIRALVEHGYSCVVCGVRFYDDRPYAFSLYALDNLPIDELRAQFSVFQTAPGSVRP